MAPHWKCGSGQPIEGSNPALSAIHARRDRARCVRWRLAPSLTHLRCARSGAQRGLRLGRARGRLTFGVAATPMTARRDMDLTVDAYELGTFGFLEPELAGRRGVVMGFAIRHPRA